MKRSPLTTPVSSVTHTLAGHRSIPVTLPFAILRRGHRALSFVREVATPFAAGVVSGFVAEQRRRFGSDFYRRLASHQAVELARLHIGEGDEIEPDDIPPSRPLPAHVDARLVAAELERIRAERDEAEAERIRNAPLDESSPYGWP